MEIYRNTNDYACAYGTWGSVHLAVKQKSVMPKDTRMPRQSDGTSLFHSVILKMPEEHYCYCKVIFSFCFSVIHL